jgi:hypothetical protein
MATSTVRNQRFEVGDLITYPRDTKQFKVLSRHVGRSHLGHVYDILDEQNGTKFHAVSLRGCTKVAS